jgi:hypothetical protein
MPTTKTRPTKSDLTAAARKVTAKTAAKRKEPALGDHPDTLGIIHRAMNSAARKAVAENDRLGIPTPGADADGRIVYRQPLKKRAGRTPSQG